MVTLFSQQEVDEIHEYHVRRQAREEGMKHGLERGRREGMERGRQEGMEKGRQDGMQKALAETVRRMLALVKYTPEEIADVTGLPLEEIEKL